MRKTRHVLVRCGQRGIQERFLRLVVENGTPMPRPGNATAYCLQENDRARMIEERKREIQALDKARGLAVVTGEDGTIITTYHRN